MPTPAEQPATAGPDEHRGLWRVALIGNPNTGKTTLFNRFSGLRHKTSNFPGTTQEARIGMVRTGDSAYQTTEIIDLPGIYSLDLDMSEAEVCRGVLEGTLAVPGAAVAAPDAVCIVIDATNLARNLLLVGEVLRRRLPTVVALNMSDLARARGLHIDPALLEEALRCRVIPCSARSGEGVDALRCELTRARIPNHTPPGTRDGLEAWADDVCMKASFATGPVRRAGATLTDRIDRVTTHPVLGVLFFAVVMAGLFWAIFSLARAPMDLLDAIFGGKSEWVRAWQPAWLQVLVSEGLTGIVRHTLPPGILSDFLAQGVVSGIGATVVFLPQICLLFFLISILEDTGYLARAAFVMDRVLRPFGLPGHSFVPLLSSHACALPGILACRGIPDRRQRLTTILVAPFMTCSARLPVYVLVTNILFRDRPFIAALAFVACYALGIFAGIVSALVARRTILRGQNPPMALELPTYKRPSFSNAFISMFDRARMFLRKAGTNILAICIVLWWLGSFPHVDPPRQAVEMREQASRAADPAPLIDEANRIEARNAKAHSYIGRLGHAAAPAFAPIGLDWQLTVGVLTSFAAREVFVSTMSVVVAGTEDAQAEGVFQAISTAQRDGGKPLFDTATCWSLLVFFVLAMQCLPTLAVTAKETGHWKWALLQLAWMSGLAYTAAALTHWALK
ncbi:MAG: ferrous iron transporter B [Planctomycetes bacterium]|nr:ferrous iron transporter B [Planctomycetota bacterium]